MGRPPPIRLPQISFLTKSQVDHLSGFRVVVPAAARAAGLRFVWYCAVLRCAVLCCAVLPWALRRCAVRTTPCASGKTGPCVGEHVLKCPAALLGACGSAHMLMECRATARHEYCTAPSQGCIERCVPTKALPFFGVGPNTSKREHTSCVPRTMRSPFDPTLEARDAHVTAQEVC